MQQSKLSTQGSRDDIEHRYTEYICEQSKQSCKQVLQQFFDSSEEKSSSKLLITALIFHLIIPQENFQSAPQEETNELLTTADHTIENTNSNQNLNPKTDVSNTEQPNQAENQISTNDDETTPQENQTEAVQSNAKVAPTQSQQQQPITSGTDTTVTTNTIYQKRPNMNKEKKLILSTDRLPQRSFDDVGFTMYVVKTAKTRVLFPPSSGTPQEVDDFMSQYVEYSILPGHSLLMLKRMVSGVYMNLLRPKPIRQNVDHVPPTNINESIKTPDRGSHDVSYDQGSKHDKNLLLGFSNSNKNSPHKSPSVHSNADQMLSAGSHSNNSTTYQDKDEISNEQPSTNLHELYANMTKFKIQLDNAIQQVHSEIQLPIPDLPMQLTGSNIADASHNTEVSLILENSLEEWSNIIHGVISQCQESLKNNSQRKRNPRKSAQYPRKSLIQGHLTAEGPMSEITFWRNRNALLSGLWEQLTKQEFRNMIKVLEISNAVRVQPFSIQLKELLHLYTEAKDNVKFLATLDRHFKNIESGNLNTMIETIPSMMNALRMVWIISRHFNSDERMVPLMDLIAIEIAEKVAAKIHIKTIFHYSPEDAMDIIVKGKKVLELWSSCYHQQRELIFNSGTDHRWEFDRKLLFEQTNYTAKICENLYSVAEVLGQFQKFLGPRLKEVTKDIQEIDELTNKVEQLKKPLENLPFNIFDRRYNASWEQMMKAFWNKVNEIEQRSKDLIDTSFQKLRSAEGAFNLLLDFKNIECRKSIQEQMMKKFTDILVHFGHEIDLVNEIFQNNKNNPPVSKDQPPVAGAIAWSRSLYARIKHVVIRFQEARELYESQEFQHVKEHYLTVAKQMVEYEEQLFENWCKKADEVVDDLLKQPVLMRQYNIDKIAQEFSQSSQSQSNSMQHHHNINNHGNSMLHGHNSSIRKTKHSANNSDKQISRHDYSSSASVNTNNESSAHGGNANAQNCFPSHSVTAFNETDLTARYKSVTSFVDFLKGNKHSHSKPVFKASSNNNNNNENNPNVTNSSNIQTRDNQYPKYGDNTSSNDANNFTKEKESEMLRLSSIVHFKNAQDRKNLILGCLLIKNSKSRIKIDKLINTDLRAVLGENNVGHLSPQLDDVLYNFTDAILILNQKEQIYVKNNIKIFQLIRDSIFQWMQQHHLTDVKLNPASNQLSKYVAQCLEEWLALNEFMTMKVNFHSKLVEIVRESKYLDRMGFEVNNSAMKVFLQENKFLNAKDQLQSMLDSYQNVLEELEYHERSAVRKCFKHLYQTIRPGFSHLNWNSLGIVSFINQSVKSIQDFKGVVARMKQSLLQIDKKIEILANTVLVDINAFKRLQQGKVMRIDDLGRKIEECRNNACQTMVSEYEAIIPLLGKIESVVVQSETRCNPVLNELYSYIEMKVFNALVNCIVKGMESLKQILTLEVPVSQTRTVTVKGDAVDGSNANSRMMKLVRDYSIAADPRSLIGVSFRMNSPPDIAISPRIPDIHKSFSTMLKSIISTALSFPRWEKHSCILCRPIEVDSDEESKLYTFYDDVKDDSRVKSGFHRVSQIIQMCFTQVQSLVNEWRKYDTQYELWNHRSLSHIDRLKGSQKPVVYFDERLRPYHRLLQNIERIPTYYFVHFIRVDVSALIGEIKTKCQEWIDKYCTILSDESSELVHQLHDEIVSMESDLSKETNNIDQLQFVLSTIQNIQSKNMKFELGFDDIFERFHCLQVYKHPIPEEVEILLQNLIPRWNNLLFESKKRDIVLLKVKQKFTKVTSELIENFKTKTVDLNTRFENEGPDLNSITLQQGILLLDEFKKLTSDCAAERSKLVQAQKLFGIELTIFPELNSLEQGMKGLIKLYQLYDSHKKKEEQWSSMLWQELDVSILEAGCNETLEKLNNLDDSLKNFNTFRKVNESILSFKQSLPLIVSLKTDALRDRHWKQLMELTKIKFDIHSSSFTLGKLFDMQLHKYIDEISKITYGAEQERKIEKKLAAIKLNWNKKAFPLASYKNVPILADTSEIETDLEDDVLNLQTLLNSRFVVHFRNDVQEWDKNLNLVTECTKVWIVVQQKWMYLEGIFIGSEDIRLQLKHAAKAFDMVHNEFKKMMENLQVNPNAIRICKTPKKLDDLKRLSVELDQCQRSLSDYLESKRNSFPRFFFISDDELLSMLGTSDPRSVQEHMLKLFVNCKKLKFRGNNVVGMESSEGESFDFKENVETSGKVEKWMNDVQNSMRDTLHLIAKSAVFHYPKQNRTDWIFDNLGMVGILGAQIWWTWLVEDAFDMVQNKGDKNAMKTLNTKLTNQINDLVEQVRQSGLTSQQRKKINTLIIIDVHARDIISNFVRDSILDANEFAWESQLRFYWDNDIDDVVIRQCTGKFRYGYEYMGLNGRLVITPLTDRCVMTLTQALTFHMGGAPAGPAGTGKTETVKDLAKSLAIPCFVTNCGEGLDYRAMGSIFSGLVQVGAWGCFDEFNRIELEVLSVVSTQLKTLLNAIKQQVDKFEFGGREIFCDPRCGFFITMNPGYAGRAELPDNLKSLFRPVTMIVPDMEQICEIMLFSEGFAQARILAKKMCVLYKLAKEQLSKQYHYDFGLRALKSVLVMAGALKRGSTFGEDMTLMRALRDMNAPKFVYEDVPLFLQLIDDLFPGLDCPRVQHKGLKDAIVDNMKQNNLKHDASDLFEKQVDKVVQLYETMLTRHTCMIVGPTQGGKTVVIETLANAQKVAFKTTIKIYRLNPKAQTVAELYGVLDPTTREWQDGVLSKIFRNVNEPLKAKQKEVRWLLFDGDVDTMWVESMNSVMDDNKLLTLPNGERMMLQDHVKLLVEVFDLQYASPATISRCGMVYVDPKDLGCKPYYYRWVRQLTKFHDNANNQDKDASSKSEQVNILTSLGEKYIQPCLDFIFLGIDSYEDGQPTENGKCTLVLPLCELNLIKQLCSVFSSIVQPKTDANNENGGQENAREGFQAIIDPDVIESIFIFSLMWSAGAALTANDRQFFDQFVKKLSERTLANVAGKNKLPKENNLFDYFFDLGKLQWLPWKSIVSEYVPPEPFVFSKVMVPTIDTVRNRYFLNELVSNQQSILFVGESGTAKTIVIQNYLGDLGLTHGDKYSTLNISFSSRTTSLDVQRNLMDNIEKRGPVWMPPGGKKLLVFIDDMSMPKVDLYGTQQPIALLKFLIERDCMYERDNELEQINTRNLYWIGAMQPPGGGCNDVDPRFISLFNTFNVVFPSDASLHRIYASILNAHGLKFNTDVQMAAQKLTELTLIFYKELVSALPATPSKFHYIFNLRDLSRVYEGVCQSTPDVYTTVIDFVRLFRNECLRIFYDRLITQQDKEFVDKKLLGGLIDNNFGAEATAINKDPIIFGDYQDSNEIENAEIYKEIGSYDKVKEIFDQMLVKYNKSYKPMNLVLFQDALEHVTRIHRILKMPRGNALLVGVGGSGKQSLTRLATYAAGYKIFEIQLTRGYNENEFREDLKRLYSMLIGIDSGGNSKDSGGDDASNGAGKASNNYLGQKCTFLFTDAHVKDESFLELINNMLTSGMVPALFEEDEKLPLIDCVRDHVTAMGINPSKENCWNFFINVCRSNLHIVLAMSPAGDTLRRRCRNFPGMVSNCVIDWFFPWPKDALLAVANHFLADNDSEKSDNNGSNKTESKLLPDTHKENIIGHIVRVHMSVDDYSNKFEIEMRRKNHITPKNYLDYLLNYKSQLTKFRSENSSRIQRLEGGLNQLIKASENVNLLRQDLTKQNEVVKEKSTECEAMIKEIKARSAEANEKKAQATKKKEELNEDAKVIAVEKKGAEEALEEALPALEMAREALKNLKKEDIAEVKVLNNPKECVKNTCLCVLNLKPNGNENPNDGWSGARAMMGDAAFLTKLKNYPRDNMTEGMYKKVQKLLKAKPKDKAQALTMDNLSRVSQAGAGLLQWVISMIRYYEVAKEVAPRRKKVQEMEKKMLQSQRDLAKTEKELSELEAQIKELSDKFEIKDKELKELQKEAEQMRIYLESAAKLIDGLGSERDRWTKDKEQLKIRSNLLVGDCLLASSFLSYTGAFSFKYRKTMIYDDWQKDIITNSIPITQPFKVQDLLTSEVERSEWVSQGLPADELSIQNGILTTRASRYPLCIDPQMQAIHWIKEREANNKVTIRTFNDNDFVKILELSIQFGNSFIFEGVDEEIDPIIDPILEGNFTTASNGQKQIKLGDNLLDWDANFRLYLVSKLTNPNYTPEIAGKTMIINFCVTQQGLEDQLLDVVVGHERPDLQKQREELIQTMSKNNILLAELENLLLKELTEATGNILENKVLINTLQDAKQKSMSIKEQQVVSLQTSEELNKVASEYRPAAKRGSILFFSMSGLSIISRMYEYSLSGYLALFIKALGNSKKDSLIMNRLRNIIDTLTKMVYDYTCTGIFEKHKLMYSFQMTTLIMEGDSKLNRNELDFFLKGNISLSDVKTAKPKNAVWIPDSGWKDLEKLSSLNTSCPSGGDGDPCRFKNILEDIASNIDQWKDWYDLERPEESELPCDYSKNSTELQKLLVLRCFRPDRVYNAVKNFVIDAMKDDYFVQPPVLQYDKILAQSNSDIPVVFILSKGADPMRDLEKLAHAQGVIANNKFKYLALGQGQAPLATQLLETGRARGHWVVLQNCHLMPSWLRTLEKIIYQLKSSSTKGSDGKNDQNSKINPSFRLWLTTDATPDFPIGILQSSLKVVTEPPDGLKLNMRASYSRVKTETLDDCSHRAFRSLVYVLSFFHAVVQERRKYGKLGWNVSYDFNESDYDTSQKLLSMYLTKSYDNRTKLPWESLRYLIGEVMYGGRVTDSFDRRTLNTYLAEYLGDFVFDDFQPFFFSKADDNGMSFDYVIPEYGKTVATYNNMIDTLPLSNSPQVLGLHSNAEIEYYTASTKYLWKCTIDLQPRTASLSGDSISREEYITNIAKDITKKIPEKFDLPILKKNFTDLALPGALAPTTVVLLQEIERWNKLVSVMQQSLVDVQRALMGEIGMSAELDDISSSLYNGYLPDMWRKCAPDTSKKLGSWMIHFSSRLSQYQAWIDIKSKTQTKDPVVIWLSGLHIPETFLAAMVQTTCRRKKWPLDKSTLFTQVTKIKDDASTIRSLDPLQDGCYVRGLYLEGAGWDFENAKLCKQEAKKLIYKLPITKIIPMETNKVTRSTTFQTPVYVTQSRRNAMGVGLVFEADLATDIHDSHWILQGTALCLNIAD